MVPQEGHNGFEILDVERIREFSGDEAFRVIYNV